MTETSPDARRWKRIANHHYEDAARLRRCLEAVRAGISEARHVALIKKIDRALEHPAILASMVE